MATEANGDAKGDAHGCWVSSRVLDLPLLLILSSKDFEIGGTGEANDGRPRRRLEANGSERRRR
jgi:hypothetical protein